MGADVLCCVQSQQLMSCEERTLSSGLVLHQFSVCARAEVSSGSPKCWLLKFASVLQRVACKCCLRTKVVQLNYYLQLSETTLISTFSFLFMVKFAFQSQQLQVMKIWPQKQSYSGVHWGQNFLALAVVACFNTFFACFPPAPIKIHENHFRSPQQVPRLCSEYTQHPDLGTNIQIE